MRRFASELSRELRALSPRQRLVAACGAGATAVLTGLSTDILPNPFFRRMTPVLWWSFPVWAATALLMGLLVATYFTRVPQGFTRGVAAGGGLLSFLAIGCPVCNKLVVALIGVSGALSVFAPVQPYLAVAGLVLLGVSLEVRVRELARCRIPMTESVGAVPEGRR